MASSSFLTICLPLSVISFLRWENMLEEIHIFGRQEGPLSKIYCDLPQHVVFLGSVPGMRHCTLSMTLALRKGVARIVTSVLTRQSLGPRICGRERVVELGKNWTETRNRQRTGIDWQFRAANARIKLQYLYPNIKE